MAENYEWDPKHPADDDWFYFIFCDPTGLNDGSADDNGFLQGATIQSETVTETSPITKSGVNRASVTIQGVTYPVDTLVAVQLAGGVDLNDYPISCKIVASDGRDVTRVKTLRVRADVN